RAGNVADWRKWDAELQSDQSIQAVRGGGTGDVTKTHVLWKVKTKTPDHLISPILVDDRLLLVKSGGFANCFGTKKGEHLWGQERIGIASPILSQPVSGDGKVYVCG